MECHDSGMTLVMGSGACHGITIARTQHRAMTKQTKIAVIVGGLMLVGLLPTVLGFVRANYERSQVSRGMSVSDVFIRVDQWNLCISSYQDQNTHKFDGFNVAKEPGGEMYRVPKYDKTFRSKLDFLDFAEQTMNNGQAWNSQFTYFAGAMRNTFRVDFDASGKVVNVSTMVGAP